MPGGQVITSARGSVTYGLTVALVGLALTASQGTMVATGNNAAALSGQSITSAQGTLPQTVSPTLTGLQIVSARGNVVSRAVTFISSASGTTLPNPQIAPAGQVVSSAQGRVTAGPANSPMLFGEAITAAQQSITASLSQALTGSAITSAAGTVLPRNTPNTSTGQSITSAQGIADPSGFTVNAHLSGQEITTAQGTIEGTLTLLGQVLTTAQGTITRSQVVPLTGQVVTALQTSLIIEQSADDQFILSRQGFTLASLAVPLVGTALTGAQGALTLNDGQQGLTGSSATSATGSVVQSLACALTGQEITGLQYNVSAPGFAALTGLETTVDTGTLFITGDRTQAITGSVSTLSGGSLVPDLRQAVTTQLITTGTGAFTTSGGNKQVALTGQSITSELENLGAVGQAPIEPTPSLEGCGITSGVALESVASQKTASSEGCFVTSNSANEVA